MAAASGSALTGAGYGSGMFSSSRLASQLFTSADCWEEDGKNKTPRRGLTPAPQAKRKSRRVKVFASCDELEGL